MIRPTRLQCEASEAVCARLPPARKLGIAPAAAGDAPGLGTIGWAAARVLADDLAAPGGLETPRLARYRRAVNRMARRAQRRASFFMRLGDPTNTRDRVRSLAVRVLALRSMRRAVYRLVVVRRP